MATYIHFTEEQKQRANSVDLEEFLKKQGDVRGKMILQSHGKENFLHPVSSFFLSR